MAIRKIVSRSIGVDVIAAEDLANNSVTAAEIQDGAVTVNKIGSGAVTEAKIGAGAVTSAKLDTNIDIAGTLDVTGATTLDDGLTVDTDTLVVDATNDRIGVNSATPSKVLDLGVGENIDDGIRVTAGTYGANIFLNNTDTGGRNYRIASAGSGNGGIGGAGIFAIYDETNGANRLAINGSGHVSLPYQPAARASYSGSDLSSTSKIPLNANNMYRGGMSIDNTNNRFNVPVSGYYVVGWQHLAKVAGCQVDVRVNGSVQAGSRSQETAGGNDGFGTQLILNLSANDYIEFWVREAQIHGNGDYNSMYAYLLG